MCSFFGVVLIARPPFLFGALPGKPSDHLNVVTPGQRMISITSGRHCISHKYFAYLASLRSAALVGVLGATCSCELRFFHPSPRPYPCRPQRHTPPCDWEARKRICKSTPCQRLLPFAMRVDLNYKVCSPSPPVSLPGDPLIGNPSMIIFKVSPVIPTNVLGLVIMFFIGTFGLIAQVCSSISFLSG